jgi:hypothetical protein
MMDLPGVRRVTASLIIASLSVFCGCGDACEDLQPYCNRCRDPNQKASCERAVDEGVQDVCELNIDYFSDICN